MSEVVEHAQLCKYIKDTYPHVFFLSDASGVRMDSLQAMRWKKTRSHNGTPDLLILAPRNGYHGLMIELKRTGEKLYKRDGVTFKTDHLEEQHEVITLLNKEGYFATFAIGFEEARRIVDEYLT